MSGKRELKIDGRVRQFLANQTIRNSYFSVLDVLATPVLMLAATPIFLWKLGAAQFGVWMLVNSIVASLGMADIGAADATIKSVSAYHGVSNTRKIHLVFSSACTLYIILSVLISVFGYTLAPYAVNAEFFMVDDIYRLPFTISLQLGALIFSGKLLEQVLLAYFKGHERYDHSAKISIASKVLTIGTQVLTVLMGGSLSNVFVNTLVVQVIMLAMELLILKRFDRALALRLTLDPKALKEIFGFGFWAWLCSILGIASMQIDKWIIGSLAGMTTLAYYSIAALVFNNLRTIMAAAAGWVFPRVSKAGIRNETSKKLYFDLQLIFMSVGLAGCLFFLFFERLFLLWLGEDAYSNSISFIKAYLLVLPIAAATITPYFFIQGGGYIRYNVVYRLIMAISNILLMFALYPILGVYGIILAYAISYVIISSGQRSVLECVVFREKNYLSGFLVLLPALFFIASYLVYAQYSNLPFSSILVIISLGAYLLLLRRRFS